ncbi:MAG: hypothetical protein ABJH68_20360 [Ilumatobacter sp.]|uniref:hypothetical protein n=1 Tax=Ilumatobacter sp. TaxID=1967498 RepID=UPI003298644C
MAWDSSRPVPWRRLIREWLIYVAVMAVVLILVFRSSNVLGAFAGLLISGPLYVLMGFVLAKFGYQRKSLKEMRETAPPPRSSTKKSKGDDSPVDVPEKRRPAPTSRTSGGGNRPKSKPRRR